MAKRTFLQLCHTLNLKKHTINGWFISEKLDGVRAFWDGGISRGIPTKDIPYANTEKDARFINEPIATGLWSRSAKVKFAPDWFLDQLPPLLLDGELWLGRGMSQQLNSIVSSHDRQDWHDVKFMIFDSPPVNTIFANGVIDIRMGSELYKLTFNNILQWIGTQNKLLQSVIEDMPYEQVYNYLVKKLPTTQNVQLLTQHRLPVKTDDISKFLEDKLNLVLDEGGEGLVVRDAYASWEASRSHNCLKYKPFWDAEAIVTGYVWGTRTDHGSKLLGKMGAMICNYNGKRLELSGFTDAERKMTFVPTDLDTDNMSERMLEGTLRAGQKVSNDWRNLAFKIGSQITFRYRELSNDGVPKEARFHRKRIEE